MARKNELDMVEKISIIIAFLFFLIGLAILNIGVLSPVTTVVAISLITLIMTQIVMISILYKIEKHLRPKR
ncbi:MAG: hypothetical protein HZB67_05815 [Candidatus Aenigmarchaeota archaeon]|nr:hypothetical protein [Candidatus Aenigmarchaeota archaeon]